MVTGLEKQVVQDLGTPHHVQYAVIDAQGDEYYLAEEHHCLLLDTTVGTTTVYLPPVERAKGNIYTIIIIAGTNACTTDDYNDDSCDFAGIAKDDLDLLGDRVCYYSDGYAWHLLGHHVS